MQYKSTSSSLTLIAQDCLVVSIHDDLKLEYQTATLDVATGGIINNHIRKRNVATSLGKTTLLHDLPGLKTKRVLLVGLGSRKKMNQRKWLQAIGSVAARLQQMPIKRACLAMLDTPVKGWEKESQTRMLIIGMEKALYRFDQFKSKSKAPSKLQQISLHTRKKMQLGLINSGIQQGLSISAGINLTKNLANLPGNVCTPKYLAKEAMRMGRENGILVKVLKRKEMKEMGMGALLGVARGSAQPPRLIRLEYQGGEKDQPPVVLVGKGLTFDAGGISIKPAAKMDEMKFDMCGGATVLGTLLAVAKLGLQMNLVGIVPSSENLLDGKSFKPGDILTSMSGQTIEILNTDAEGRLILADALTYSARFKPAFMIDIATLTGACVIALGAEASGLFTNDEKLAKKLLDAGQLSNDRAWRLPLWEEYQQHIDTHIADVANSSGREGSSITAACFLSRFTKGQRWAHLDIAGTAWTSGRKRVATGRPVPMLVEFLRQYSLNTRKSTPSN